MKKERIKNQGLKISEGIIERKATLKGSSAFKRLGTIGVIYPDSQTAQIQAPKVG